MTTLRDDLLDVADSIRGIPDELGVRLFKVSIRVRTWNGSRPGVDSSSSSDTNTYFWVDGGCHRIRVRQLTQREIIASGGLYTDQDLRIGPITPPYPGPRSPANNSAYSIFEPAPNGSPVEIFFKVEGPGMAASGSWFKAIKTDVTRPFRYEFVVQRTGEVP